MGSEIYPEVHDNLRAFFSSSSPILLEPLAHGSSDWSLPMEDCITLHDNDLASMRLYSMANKVSEVKEDGPVGGVEAGTGAGIDGVAVEEYGTVVEGAVEGGMSEDGGASKLFPFALRGPLKVTEGSSRFQQFFFTYATLMAGLRLLKTK